MVRGSWFWDLDRSELTLVAHDIILQRTEQSLGMLGSQDHTAPDGTFRYSGEDAREVDDEVTT